MANFWHKPPKYGPQPSQWRPGERRSYIPVISFGRPENTPAEGVVGKTVDVNGTKTVSFVVRGPKTEGTGRPK